MTKEPTSSVSSIRIPSTIATARPAVLRDPCAQGRPASLDRSAGRSLPRFFGPRALGGAREIDVPSVCLLRAPRARRIHFVFNSFSKMLLSASTAARHSGRSHAGFLGASQQWSLRTAFNIFRVMAVGRQSALSKTGLSLPPRQFMRYLASASHSAKLENGGRNRGSFLFRRN